LDLVQGLAVGGVTDTQAVDGDGAVAVDVSGDINITVVEIVERQVPVSS